MIVVGAVFLVVAFLWLVGRLTVRWERLEDQLLRLREEDLSMLDEWYFEVYEDADERQKPLSFDAWYFEKYCTEKQPPAELPQTTPYR